MLSRKPVNRRRESQKSSSTESAVDGNASANGVPGVSGGDVSHLDQIDLDLEEADILDGVSQFVVDPIGFNVLDADPKTKAMQAKAMQGKKAKAKKNKKEEEAKKAKKKLTKDDPKTRQKKEKVLALAKKDAREEFEQEKAEILSIVPESIKVMFGQIGFGKWGKQSLPCLILSPYQVPPGPARNIWMEMYNKMRENDRPLERMSFLVYWYGEEKPSDYYSLIPFSGFTPWDKSTKKMQDFAKSAETRRDADKKLTADDRQKIRGIEQLREDLEKDPNVRARGDVDFLERDELLSMKDVDELSADDLSDDEEVGDVKRKSPEVVVKLQAGQKSSSLDTDHGKDSDVDLHDEDNDDDEMELETPTKKPKRRTSSTTGDGKSRLKKRNRAAMESNSAPNEASVEEADEESHSKSKKKKDAKKKGVDGNETHDPLPRGESRGLSEDVEKAGIRGEDREMKPRSSNVDVPTADVGNEMHAKRIAKTKRENAATDCADQDLGGQPSGKGKIVERQLSLVQSGDDSQRNEGDCDDDEMAAPVKRKTKKKAKVLNEVNRDVKAAFVAADDLQSSEINADSVVPKQKSKKENRRGSLDNGATYASEHDAAPDKEAMGAFDGAMVSKNKRKRSEQPVIKTDDSEQQMDEDISELVPVPKKKRKKSKQPGVPKEEEELRGEALSEDASPPTKKKKEKKKQQPVVKTEEDREHMDEDPQGGGLAPKKKGRMSLQPGVKTKGERENWDEEQTEELPIPKKKGKKSNQPIIKTVEEGNQQMDEEQTEGLPIPKKKGKKSKPPIVNAEEDGGQLDEEPQDEVPVPKKKGKKTKQAFVNAEGDGDHMDGEPQEEVPSSKKKGKRSKQPAVNAEDGDGEHPDNEPHDEVPVPKKKGKKPKQPAVNAEDEDGEHSDKELQEEIPVPKKIGKSSKQPIVNTEDEVGEQMDQEPQEEVQVPKKKGKRSKQPVIGTEGRQDPDEEPALDGDDIETAKRIFSKNEEDFQSVLEKWLSAIEEKDTENIIDCLGKLLIRLPKLGSRFIEVYNIANYFKETKIVLKQKEHDSGIDLLVRLKRSMKEHYQIVRKRFPPFEPDVKYRDLAYPGSTKQGDDIEDGRVQSQDSLGMYPHTTSASPIIHSTAIVSELSHDIKQEEFSQSDTKQAAVVAKKLGWTKDPVVAETTDSQRLMCIEFLRQMALQFPEGKVNADAVAISIEQALFEFVGGSVGRLYFDRLHSLVAAVCGDVEPGSLMRKIENGDFKSPKELVSLPNDKLFMSFRGEEGEGAAS